MSVLAFTGDRNTEGKKDYTGAFAPEAKGFANTYRGIVVSIDTSKPREAQRKQMCDAILHYQPTTVAIFCHGYTAKIQLGFEKWNVSQLAKALATVGCERVGLYCCSTASGPKDGGDGGFADTLRDEMCKAGLIDCWVMGHITAGHTSTNPRKRIFEGRGQSQGGSGGTEIVPQSSPYWRTWCNALKDDPAFRFGLAARYSSVTEICQDLETWSKR